MKLDDTAFGITDLGSRTRWFTVVDGILRVEHEAFSIVNFDNIVRINSKFRIDVSVGLKLIYDHLNIKCDYVYLAKADKDTCEFIESQYPEYIMLYKGIEGGYYITVPDILPKEAKTMIDLMCIVR
jgi:hypothetical protein